MGVRYHLPFMTRRSTPDPQNPRSKSSLRLLRALRFIVVLLAVLLIARAAAAHPAPFSYIDITLGDRSLEVSVVAHVFDLAHDLNVATPEQLLDGGVARGRLQAIAELLAGRIGLQIDGEARSSHAWALDRILADRQSLRFTTAFPLDRAAGRLTFSTLMFPYDPNHQTFVNVYERGALTTQAILDVNHRTLDYFAGTRQGALAVVRKFLPAGIHHILIGPDHLLFLVGLLLLGGTIRQLAVVVTAFTVAHSITLSLAALNFVTPPTRIIEPAIALSIVYVGADNLLVRDGRDVRAWIAFAFGFIHGFGFASVLREMELPSRALGWSLFSFNVGVEIGQLLVVVTVASALAMLRARSEAAGRRLAFAGSVVVIAAGAFWFVQRVFFPGGIS